jgi:hypothetical protein
MDILSSQSSFLEQEEEPLSDYSWMKTLTVEEEEDTSDVDSVEEDEDEEEENPLID